MTRLWVLALSIMCASLVTMVVHKNHTSYLTQRACLEQGGNWEPRENSSEIGCRMFTQMVHPK